MVSATAPLGGCMTIPASLRPPHPSLTLATGIVDVPGSPLGPQDIRGPLGIIGKALGDPRVKIRESTIFDYFSTKRCIFEMLYKTSFVTGLTYPP